MPQSRSFGRVPRCRTLATRAVGLVVVLALAACAPSASRPVQVSGAWVRAPMSATGPAGAFMTVSNPGSAADALVAVASPAAEAVEVHETTMEPDGSMGMAPIERLEIPAGGSVELKSGSYHIMLIGLTAPLAAGDTVELTLTFESGATVTVTAEVRAG